MGPKLFTLPNHEGLILVGVIILIVVAVRVVPLLVTPPKLRTDVPLGAERNYGIGGGGVCPHCHRPMVLSLWALKVGLGTKLVRCEFCGKWGLVRRLSLGELRAAEAAELSAAQPALVPSAEHEAKKAQSRLDDTRFTDQ
jgi:hypothetical protein